MSLISGRKVVLPLAGLLALAGLGLGWQTVGARSNVGSVAHQSPANHTIVVGGHADVSVAPDEATVSLGTQSRASDAKSAQSASSGKMSAIIAAVEGQGIPANKIRTDQVSLYYDDQKGVYVATQNVVVTIDDVSKVGPVIDAAVGAGADNSWGVDFGLKDPSTARGTALQNAIADARKRANAMASALGVNVTGVVSAQESSQIPPPIPVRVAAPAAGTVNSTPVQPGELTVSADVSVTYSFG